MPPPNHAWAAASTSTDISHSRKLFSQSGGSTSAYARHLQATDAYLRYYGGSIPTPEKARSERDILEENHQFIRDEEDNQAIDEEKMLAKKYYDRLFKEFAVVELAKWEQKQVAMRWRMKEEVLSGKGQFSCANLSCGNRESTLDEDPDDTSGVLQEFELMFEYVERGENRNALVKVRVCDECTAKLRHIQGSDGQKGRCKRPRDKDERKSRKSHHRQGSRSHEERGRRKDNYAVGNRNRGRDRDEDRRQKRRSRSPKLEGEGHRSRHHSLDAKNPLK